MNNSTLYSYYVSHYRLNFTPTKIYASSLNLLYLRCFVKSFLPLSRDVCIWSQSQRAGPAPGQPSGTLCGIPVTSPWLLGSK